MFSKPTSKPAPARPQAEPVPIPPLPDLNAQRRPPSGAAPAVAAAPARAGSVLSVDLTLEGGISGAGDLQIDGTVKGDVRVSRLVVGETGNVEGAVTCDSVEVRGRIVGSVNAKAVKLTSTAYVDGDIA
ncbi:MAG TPA: polymer-forming cytoskeletal protein, partial [Caulobacteraceae bacterium]